MVEHFNEKELSDLFKCISDETRRSLLVKLCQDGPCRVTELASHYEMSLNAISKHLKVLEKCSLISRTTEGRTHWLQANLAKVHKIEIWLEELKSVWEARLDKLAKIIESEK